MLNLLLFVISYFVILYSVLGYGLFFEKVFYKKNYKENIGYVGLYGIFFLIIYSYYSSLIFAHNFTHNTIILILGLVYFIVKFGIFKKNKYFYIFNIIFLILLISSFIFKTHDDFPYYHFPYTYYLNESSLIIGVGQYNHGFRTPSSLFYLNSLFYLPFIKYHMYSMTAILIMGFANLILLEKIFENLNRKNISFISYFCLLSFIFINVFFYRISEHGTDKSAQILVLIFFIEIFLLIKFFDQFEKYLDKIFILLGIIISLKSFFLLYLIFFIPFIIILMNKKKTSMILKIFDNKFFIPFILFFIILLFINFVNSGCLVYPVHLTCFDNFQWSIGSIETLRMNNWYEQWSKAGAGPNFRVENAEFYIQNFNWVQNWFQIYFFNKISDLLLGLILLILIVGLTFYNKLIQKVKFDRDNLLIYLFIIILLFEWFYNHPALRYGGYGLLAALIFIPFSFVFQKFKNSSKSLKKKFLVLICLSLVIFFTRNIYRISNEIKVYNYKPFSEPFYKLDEVHFRVDKQFNELISNYHNCVDGLKCDQMLYKKVDRTIFKKYLFINIKKKLSN